MSVAVAAGSGSVTLMLTPTPSLPFVGCKNAALKFQLFSFLLLPKAHRFTNS
jgi:hypothetical protein